MSHTKTFQMIKKTFKTLLMNPRQFWSLTLIFKFFGSWKTKSSLTGLNSTTITPKSNCKVLKQKLNVSVNSKLKPHSSKINSLPKMKWVSYINHQTSKRSRTCPSLRWWITTIEIIQGRRLWLIPERTAFWTEAL